MKRLSASELREDLASAVNQVAFGGERIVIRRNRKDVAVLVSMEDLAVLRALEDRADRRAARRAKAEQGENIPWADAKRELGL